MRNCILLLLLGSLSVVQVFAKDIYVNDLKSLVQNTRESNVTLYICSPIDLEGKVLQLPARTTLHIRNGKLFNGTLLGNKTKLLTDNPSCLGIIISGTWIVPIINDSCFNERYLDDNAIMSNINSMQSDECDNTIHLYRDYDVNVDSKSYAAFVLKSNSKLYIHSSVKIKPNNYAKYAIIDITCKQNVSIEGGLIIGDVGKHKYISNSTSEWGMGINVVASQKITISNTTISLCSGDGVYLGGFREDNIGVFENACKNIRMSNVICNQNRRQGLSIVHAKDVTISDCQFINTGQVEFTKPGHGIDIEPNISNNRNMSVSDVAISRCKFMGNRRKSLSTAHYFCTDANSNIKNIIIKDSYFDGEITIRSGSFYISNTHIPRICVFISSRHLDDIDIENCIISGGLYLHSSNADDEHPEYTGILKNFIVTNCHFTNQVKNKGNAILALSGDMSRVKNLKFIKCEFADRGSNLANVKLFNRERRGVSIFDNCRFASKRKK